MVLFSFIDETLHLSLFFDFVENLAKIFLSTRNCFVTPLEQALEYTHLYGKPDQKDRKRVHACACMDVCLCVVYVITMGNFPAIFIFICLERIPVIFNHRTLS